MTEHVYILDYGTGSILHVELPDSVVFNKEISNLMDYLGLNDDECSYMITDKKLEIEEFEPV